jgi:hypothetical protein
MWPALSQGTQQTNKHKHKWENRAKRPYWVESEPNFSVERTGREASDARVKLLAIDPAQCGSK